MIQRLLFAVLTLCPFAHATTYAVNPGQSQSTIQRIINGTSSSGTDTVSFTAGNYSVGAGGYRLKCGVTYTGPTANPATAILSSTTGQSNSIFNLSSASCSSTTTVEYFGFRNSGGVYIQLSFSNIVITHNQFSNLPCCNSKGSVPGTVGIFADGGTTTPATKILTNAAITDNTIGDVASCTGPTNSMTSFASPETIQGNCAGIVFTGSVDGLTIDSNVIGPVGEGVHFQCPGDRCEPTNNPPGPTIKNLTAQFNDFVGIHRIAWEEQPQATQNAVFEYNSEHDATNPYFGNFDLSFACCDSGATAPGITVSNNVLIANTKPHVRYGYGIEAWGRGGIYSNNLVEGLNTSLGIAYCYGMGSGKVTNNTVTGSFKGSSGFGGDEYIGNEGTNKGCSMGRPGMVTGNVEGNVTTAIPSFAPAISPIPSGTYSSPIKVTLDDPGYTSGPQPLGNTSIYYTTNGTTPTVDSPLYHGPFSVAPGSTVKAIGMWGTGANPKSYPAGYGYVPSPVISAVYTAAGSTPTTVPTQKGKSTPTLQSAHLESTSNTLAVGSKLQVSATGVYSDGSSIVFPNAAIDWWTSNPAVLKANGAGLVTAVAAGVASVKAKIGSLSISPWTVTVKSAARVTDVVPAPRGHAVGDKFLGPFWRTVAPAGGSTSISNGHLFLEVPGGSNHDSLFPSNQSVRVAQAIGNYNFDVSIKIDSMLVATDAGTSQGLMILSDDKNFITFALKTDGTRIGLRAQIITAGSANTVLDDTDFSQYQNPMYLRLTKTGSSYVAFYSVDGATWLQAVSFTDNNPPTSIGPFADNYNATPAKAVPVTMAVNWFNVQ